MSSILFLTQLLPFPLDAGPKTRAYYVLKHLTRTHKVTLLSFSRPNDPQEAIEHLKEMCAEVITVPMLRSTIRDVFAMVRSILINQPFVITRDTVPGMLHTIERILKANSFDYVHADQLWMAQYALYARRLTDSENRKLRVILDQHNAVYLIPKRMMANAKNPVMKIFLGRESRLLAKFEVSVCRKCDHVVWVTAEDFNAIKLVAKDGFENSTILPICVDPITVRLQTELSPQPRIIFLGGMHWPPNAEGVKWFMREVLPIIHLKLPEAQVVAVGKSPPREIIDVKNVHAAGFVEDVSAYWQDSRVFIVPIHAAGGMRVKILDAWAHGLPVVSTSIGAEGIAYQNGRDILVADDAEDFADCVVRLITDEWLANRLSRAGRKTLEDNYDWKKVYRSWDEIYQPAGR